MYFYHLLYVISVIYCFFGVTLGCKGCINLDEHNFEKVIPRFEAALIKFDVSYPYGDKHEIFSKFAEEVAALKNVIVGEVGIKDYGDRENEEFAKKFGVKSKDDLPAIKLFLKSSDKYIDFPYKTDITVDNLRNLLRDNTNIYIGLPGCIEKYDKLAMKFVQSSSKDKELKEAEKLVEKAREEEKSVIKTYVLFMKKIISEGINFIKQEKLRLSKIIKEGKMNDLKKTEMTQRLNILHSFSIVKDEL